jgi:protein TonB
MSSMYLAPRQPIRAESVRKRKKLALFDFLPHTAGRRLPGRPRAFAGEGPALRAGEFMSPDMDRSVTDALLVAALILLAHVTIYERFTHEDPPPPKQKRVEIELFKPPPPPPPPPPVIQPKPEPPVVKEIAPPKPAPKPLAPPKPKPKAQPKPKPSPFAAKPAAPVLEDVPFDDNAPPVEAAPAEPPAPPPAPPKPVDKVVQITDADYVRPLEPEYPEEAADRGIEGRVVVKARILPSGEPGEVLVETSSGHSSLDGAAIQAVKAALFRPNMVDDLATNTWVLIPITFQL